MAQENGQETDCVTAYIWNATLKVAVFLCDLFAFFLLDQDAPGSGVWSVSPLYWAGLSSTAVLGKIQDSIYN